MNNRNENVLAQLRSFVLSRRSLFTVRRTMLGTRHRRWLDSFVALVLFLEAVLFDFYPWLVNLSSIKLPLFLSSVPYPGSSMPRINSLPHNSLDMYHELRILSPLPLSIAPPLPPFSIHYLQRRFDIVEVDISFV